MSAGPERTLKKGYTTGTCAQAAARAAMLMLTSGKPVSEVEVETASGVRLKLGVIPMQSGQAQDAGGFARCGVIKDSGDDPDVTDGAEIYAEVKLVPGGEGVRILGGRGVGTVTKPGLPVPPGEPAINPVPRRMISAEVAALLPKDCGAEVTITVPDGERLAAMTFNPRLGIVGGISILGTSGIVEPRSEEAYRATLSLQVKVAKAAGLRKVALCPGYLGERFCSRDLGMPEDAIIRVGDHVGFALGECAKSGVEQVLLVGHVGKLVKIAVGIFNTHHTMGDARMETIAACAALCGAGQSVVKEIMAQDTAEATVAILRQHGLMAVFDSIAERVVQRASRLVQSRRVGIECVILDLKGEVLGRCP
ncbi:MAG: cobalt-precorrin-5B (C(1))-methyltransferase CbiD [Dehalococcoidia bacterium]|nr:cobalt-precorrin-5B (C(1))-methyltransferase CbiD [Dehalococcoidia bacterium]